MWIRPSAEGTHRAWCSALLNFLGSEEAFYKYLPAEADGWTRGGCDTLATALMQVIPGAELYALVFTERQGQPEHYVVRIPGPTPPLYLDGDGAQSKTMLFKLWSARFGCGPGDISLIPASKAYVEAGRRLEATWCSEKQASALAWAITSALGPFPVGVEVVMHHHGFRTKRGKGQRRSRRRLIPIRQAHSFSTDDYVPSDPRERRRYFEQMRALYWRPENAERRMQGLAWISKLEAKWADCTPTTQDLGGLAKLLSLGEKVPGLDALLD